MARSSGSHMTIRTFRRDTSLVIDNSIMGRTSDEFADHAMFLDVKRLCLVSYDPSMTIDQAYHMAVARIPTKYRRD